MLKVGKLFKNLLAKLEFSCRKTKQQSCKPSPLSMPDGKTFQKLFGPLRLSFFRKPFQDRWTFYNDLDLRNEAFDCQITSNSTKPTIAMFLSRPPSDA
jgi:hypothetical protein